MKSFRSKDKDSLLANYEASFFPNPTRAGSSQGKGKLPIHYPTPSALYKSCMMRPWLSAQFSVEASLDNVVLFLVRDGWLDRRLMWSMTFGSFSSNIDDSGFSVTQNSKT